MDDNAQNNKRIAKNTIFLYIRMLILMLVSLYTSRVVLSALGVVDYGIYNVVGGIITLFTFVNGGMISATQRYLTYEIGKSNFKQLNKVFSTSLLIHAFIAVTVFLLGETVGIWLLYEKLVIPAERMTAAFWVYQCSIIACLVNIMSVPYNAMIVANEKMSAFAYISILEAVLKLVIVYVLYITPWSKLISYSCLVLSVQIIIRFIYANYCKKHFPEAHFDRQIDKSLLKEIASFAGWSLTTSIAYVLSSQGLNIMLNIFFGPVVNAARAIAVQIQGTVRQFVNSVQMAINPQITKNYASSQLIKMHSLMCRCARFSYILLYLLSLPLLIETEYILAIWLKTVPDNTIIFTRLILILTLLYPFSNPLIIANQATGKVKKYEMVSGLILLSLLPLSYIFLKAGTPAYFVYLINILLEFITFVFRLILIRKDINLSISYFVTSAILPAVMTTIVSCIPPLLVFYYVNNNLERFVFVNCVSVLSVLISVYFLGITKEERAIIVNKLKYKCKKIINNN